MTDANGKNHRQFKHNLRSRKFANVQVLTLSRRKQGFESPRERQCNQTLNLSASVGVQQLSNKRLWTGMDGMQIGQHVRSVWPYRSDLGATLRLAPPK